jgi:hypothetical protein
VITPGQAHDSIAFPAVMQEIDCNPEHMLGDKGYDSEAVRRNAVVKPQSRAPRPGKYSMRSRPFMPCEIESSASSIAQKIRAASSHPL